MNYKLISIFIIVSFSNFVMAQLNEKLELNEGVKSYEQGDYKTAEQHFLNSFDDHVLVFEDTEKDISVSAVSTPNSLKNSIRFG